MGLDLELFRNIMRQPDSFPPEINSLIQEREAARAARDFKRADELRSRIEGFGIGVRDQPNGVTVYVRLKMVLEKE